MYEWYPIETAPLDGTEIILRIVALDGSSRSVEVLNAWYDSRWQRFCNNSNCRQRLDFGDITHWMPLLKPSSE